MTFEYTQLLEFSQYQKSAKAPFIIYANVECTIENIDGCIINPVNSSTTEVSKHIPCRFSMPTICSFRRIENKHNVYREQQELSKNAYYVHHYTGEYRGAAQST